jgi:hypothetical protein
VENSQVFGVYQDLLSYSDNSISTMDESTQLLFADVKLVELGNSEAELSLTLGFGQPKPRRCYVQSDDYWYAAYDLGPCGNGQPQTGINDAADRINQLINNRHCSSPTCPGGGEGFYVNIEEKYLFWNSQTNNWYFWFGNSAYNCFDPGDIQYWWDHAEDVIEDERPAGKSFVDVNYIWEFALFSSEWIHAMDPVRYGIFNCSGGIED